MTKTMREKIENWIAKAPFEVNLAVTPRHLSHHIMGRSTPEIKKDGYEITIEGYTKNYEEG